jgi:hypothetical protein
MAMRKPGNKLGKKALEAKRAITHNSGDFSGPSPNPRTNLVIADVALRSGSMLARRAVERALLGSRYAPRKARAILKGRSFTETLLHTAIAKVATRSVPGMIVVGGGILAKTLYDRSKGGNAKLKGEMDMAEMADEGEKD